MESTIDNDTKNKTERRLPLWDTPTHMVFIELCLNEARLGNKPGSHFNKAGYENLIKNMKEQTGKTLTYKQIKNHWETMKKDWRLFDRLMRIESGIGWDPANNSIVASPEWWDEKIKADKDYAKFMGKNLEMYQIYYESLFRGSVATGDRARAPSEFQNLDDQHEEPLEGKGYATQNIMAACDFNMCFTFAWAGWEGTAHDTRIFNEALRKPELNFPHPMGDKYYLVDAGYPNTRGYLAPYKGTNIRYHLPDFRRGETAAIRAPKGAKETFNYFHSSLRNVIERTFGVWKARWAILKDMHINLPYETQVNIVLASMAIHNYIRMKDNDDEAFGRAQQESYNPGRDFNSRASSNGNEPNEDTSARRRDDDLYMSAVRDMIAGDIIRYK